MEEGWFGGGGDVGEGGAAGVVGGLRSEWGRVEKRRH